MKNVALIVVFTMGALLGITVEACLAERVYVTDSFNITFRSGPSTSHKIIRMLDSGQELEALRSEEGWTLARLPRGSGETVEGWVLDRYLIRRQPWEMQASRLRTENEGLRNKLVSVEAEWAQVRGADEKLRAELAGSLERLEKLRKEYDNLKKGASEYLDLRREYQEMRSQFDDNMEKLQRLSEENRVLRSLERTKWFVAGGAVLLCGLLIGLAFGRREKKRRSAYY